MENHILHDVIESKIFPKLPGTDLVLMKKAFPELGSVITKILESRQKSLSSLRQTYAFTVNDVSPSPQLSPSTGTLMAYRDQEGARLVLCSLFDGTQLADVFLDLPEPTRHIKFNRAENFVTLIKNCGVAMYKIVKDTQQSQQSISNVSLKKFISVYFDPSYKTFPQISGNPDVFSTMFMSEISSKSYAIIRFSHAVISGAECDAIIRLDIVIGDVDNEIQPDQIDLYFNSSQFTEHQIVSDHVSITFMDRPDPNFSGSPQCSTLFLRSTRLQLLDKAEILLDPLRVHFPSNDQTPFCLLVNPSLADNGPWSKLITGTGEKILFKSQLSPSQKSISVAWDCAGTVLFERIDAKNGTLNNSLTLPIPKGNHVLEVLESPDGRLCSALYGKVFGKRAHVFGWSTGDINQKGVITVNPDHQLKTPNAKTDRIGPITYLHENFGISSDGQLVSAIIGCNSEENGKILVIFHAATGEIVSIDDAYPPDYMNDNMLLNGDNVTNTRSFTASFSKQVSDRIAITTRVGNRYWIGTKTFGV